MPRASGLLRSHTLPAVSQPVTFRDPWFVQIFTLTTKTGIEVSCLKTNKTENKLEWTHPCCLYLESSMCFIRKIWAQNTVTLSFAKQYVTCASAGKTEHTPQSSDDSLARRIFFFLWNDGNDGDMSGRWEQVAPSLFHLIFRRRAEVAQERGEMQGTSLWAALFSPLVQWHSNGALKYSGTMVFQTDGKWSPPKDWKQKIYFHLYTSQIRYVYIMSHIVKITPVPEQWGAHEKCSTSQAQSGF